MAPWEGGGFTFDDFKRMAALHPEGAEVQMLEVSTASVTTAMGSVIRHAALFDPAITTRWVANAW